MKAPLPANEAARLAALDHYNLLDTAPEVGFDDLTLLAAQRGGRIDRAARAGAE